MSVSEYRPFRWVAFSGDSPNIDGGSRLRVSQLNTLIDIKQINDNAPLFLDRVNIGGASQTYNILDGGSTMQVANAGDAAICQSRMFAPYYAGKGQFIEITFSGFESEEGVTKRAGYFSSSTAAPYNDDKDGIWLQSDGDSQRFIIQKNGTTMLEAEKEAHWNDDVKDIDFSKFNVLVIQFLYLGGTAVRFGFVIEGQIVWAYTYVHAGEVENTFIQSPDQPVRYEIRSTGGAGSFVQICAEVASEGSLGEVGVQTCFHAHDFQANAQDVVYAVLGVRLRADRRNIRAILKSLSFQAENNDDFLWVLMLNPTIGGNAPSWGNVDGVGIPIENSVLEVAVGDTTNIVSAIELREEAGSVEGTTAEVIRNETSIHIGQRIDGTFDELWVGVRPRTTGLDVDVTMNMQEFL